MVSPDGVAPSRVVGVSASVNLPLHRKVQKFSSGTGSPGWSRKNGRKTVVVVTMGSFHDTRGGCAYAAPRVALSVEALRVTGAASDGETVGPTMLWTYSESAGRPYVDAVLDVNPLDGSSSVRVVVFVQAMTVVFDAVSLQRSLLFYFKTRNVGQCPT